MNIPENLSYTEEHEWIKIEGNQATIGITDFAQGELGDIVFVEIEAAGDEFEAGEVIGSLEAVKTVSDIYTPVAGTILELNDQLEAEPELINSDPYGAGWLVKIELKEATKLANLLSAAAYTHLIQ